MKIGIDITPLSVGLGGVPRYTRALVERIAEADTESEYTLFHAGPVNGLDLANGPSGPRVKVHCWPRRVALLALLARRLPTPSGSGWFGVETGSLRSRWKAPLMGLDGFHSSDVFLWDNRPGKNIITMFDITTVLHPEFHTRANVRVHERKIAFVKEAVHKVIAISECTKRDLIEHCDIPADRIKVIYPGCDHRRFRLHTEDDVAPVLKRYGLGRGYILSVGTIEPRKNVERLIEAFETLGRLGRGSERLVLVGAKGWLSASIFRRVELSPASNRITWLGNVPEADLGRLYAGAGLLVYPSVYEGFGLPLVEAMACGVPVVGASTSSIPEIVGDAGVLVDPFDAGELARAVHGLLVDEELRDELRRRAIERARYFSWERMALEIAQTYREVIGP